MSAQTCQNFFFFLSGLFVILFSSISITYQYKQKFWFVQIFFLLCSDLVRSVYLLRALLRHNLVFILASFEDRKSTSVSFVILRIKASSFEDFLVRSEQLNGSFIRTCPQVVEHHLSPNVFLYRLSPFLPVKYPYKHG